MVVGAWRHSVQNVELQPRLCPPPELDQNGFKEVSSRWTQPFILPRLVNWVSSLLWAEPISILQNSIVHCPETASCSKECYRSSTLCLNPDSQCCGFPKWTAIQWKYLPLQRGAGEDHVPDDVQKIVASPIRA